MNSFIIFLKENWILKIPFKRIKTSNIPLLQDITYSIFLTGENEHKEFRIMKETTEKMIQTMEKMRDSQEQTFERMILSQEKSLIKIMTLLDKSQDKGSINLSLSHIVCIKSE